MEPSSTDPIVDTDGRLSPSTQKSEPTEPIDRSEIAPARSSTGKDECYLVLAQVNLLRIRKQSSAAIELCESALRRWPFRPDAHALMGDLYGESGKIDDAILRYCRALEIEPRNKPNRKKLNDMVRLKRLQLGPITSNKARSSGLRLDRVARAVILGLATIMLVTIMVTPTIFQRRKQLMADDPTATIDRRISLDPIVLQPAPPSASPPASSEPNESAVTAIRDPVEEALVDLMSNDKTLLSLGIQVLNAEEDPSTNAFSITFLDRPVTPQDTNKSAILRNALEVAESANTRFGSRAVGQLTIRCLLLISPASATSSSVPQSVTGTTPLVFVGTIARSQIPTVDMLTDSSTADQLQAYFGSPWWSDSIQ